MPTVAQLSKYRRSKSTKPSKPDIRNLYNGGRKYTPSYNISPSQLMPVLVSAKHFDPNAMTTERLLVPMTWGMVPQNNTGDKHRVHNCRMESIEQSPMFGPPLRDGQRCVALCEGYYEWRDKNSPYYLYMPPCHAGDSDKEIRLTAMAAVFNIQTDNDGDKLYSYSLLTKRATSQLEFINSRMPAILQSESLIQV